MGFLGDVKEIQEGCKEKSWGYKVLVIVSIFFTTSSLTGLSDHIIKWRGFIKDGLGFYHEWIVGPTCRFFGILSINLTEFYIHLLTINLAVGIPILMLTVKDRYYGLSSYTACLILLPVLLNIGEIRSKIGPGAGDSLLILIMAVILAN